MASADRLIEVFNEAKARPVGAERDQFLSEACRNEPSLKEQVLSLVQAHEGAGDFLKNTQAIPPITVLTEKPGDKIGRYKLLQKIGEGGCGVVYMAEQEEPVRRRVALKVIKLGMDTKQVVARFEAEEQTLALMDHANIAKVFDAGATDTGRPYFVMELVRGIKITEYCDQNNLPTEARLKLLTQVCHAIQHAHQKGIIHRDIKPSNILVTVNDGVPVPKVIDFGIAKAIEQRLTDKTVFTAFEQFIGTPAYMSPEQAEMTSLDIDTRADIYSLGVLLYELLSGNTPFDAEKLVASGVAEIRRVIREQEPLKPSTRLNTLNDADLSTVAQRRHTEAPRLIQLVRGDLDWIVMKCLEKDRTRRYETANALAMDLQRHLNDEPVVACPPTNLYRFQKLVRRNKLAVTAVSAVTTALVLGIVASSWQALRATRAEQAQIKLRQLAEANEQKAISEAAKSQQFAQFLQDTFTRLGPNLLNSKFIDQSKLAGAELMLKEHLAKRRERLGDEHLDVAVSLNTLTLVLQGQGKLVEAEAAVREALTIWRKRFGVEHLYVTFSLGCLGGILQKEGKLPEAEAVVREALAIKRKQLGNEHPEVIDNLRFLAELLQEQGKLPEAESTIREMLTMRRNLFGNEHPDVGNSLAQLADLLGRERKYAEARIAYHDAAEHADAQDLNEMAWTLATAADPKLRDGPGAVTFAEKAVAATNRKNPLILDTLAAACAETGQFTNAVGVQQEAIALMQDEKKKEDYTYRLKLYESNLAYRNHGRLAERASALLAEGKFAEAEPPARECLVLREKQIPDDWLTFNARSVLGGSLLGQKKYAEAEPLLLSGYEGMKQREDKIPAIGKPRLKETLQRLVQLYEGMGQSEKAGQWNTKSAESDKAEAEKKTAVPKP